ncbi:MAG: sugar ABC transporter permease [Spirochaetaceae bacterium]|nr:MAG: sugar ABC transporter permease [Spirochaetaceae bacterium]
MSATKAQKAKPSTFLNRNALRGYLFILPCLLLLLLVLGFPMAVAVANSFSPLWSAEKTFTLDNYINLAKDVLFWNALKVTGIFVSTTVGLHLVIGFAVALALNAAIKARRFFRLIAILPWTVPDVISGLIWRFMYNPTSGILNDVLMRFGLAGDYIEWLAQPGLALPSVVLADVWRGYPFVMVILLAGLQAIPKELYEAARVDGATRVQEFLHITIPGLLRITLIALALDTIWQIRRFGLVYNMTLGGPGHVTEILSLYVYKHYFKYFNFEYASAIAVVMAVLMLAISYPYIRTVTRRA